MKVLEIAEQYKALESLLDQEDQEISDDEMLAMLEQVDDLLEQKVDNMAALWKDLDTQEQTAKERAEVWAAKAKSCKTKAESVKNLIRLVMQKVGVKQIVGDRFPVTLCKGSVSVTEVNLDLLPPEFIRQKPAPPPEPDKVAILNHYRTTGELIDGAKIEEGPAQVRIR